VAQQIPLEKFLSGYPRGSRLLFFAIGALLMLSFAPVGWYGLGLALILPLLVSCQVSSPKTAAHHGFWFGSGLFLAGTYWLYICIHVFGRAPLWIALFLMVGLVLIMGLYYALTAWLICRLSNGKAWRLLLVAPAAWTLVEWIRGWFLSGFPWMTLGYGQIDSPLSGFAPIFGVYGISAVLVFSAAALVAAVSHGTRKPALLLVLAATPWIAGVATERLTWTAAAGDPVQITIVQGGIPQDRKWLPEQFQQTLELYAGSLASNPDSEIIVWPEVAIPAVMDQVPRLLEQLDMAVRNREQTLLLGILEQAVDRPQVYNSVLLLGGPRMQTYRKRHLVPFGEVFPVPDFVREWMRLMSLPNSDMQAGAAQQALLETANGQKLSVAICYEDAYGAEQLYSLAEAGILINVSNDAWFGDTIAPHQHLEIARMRALEAGRYVVRSTNNGVSAFIGPDGSLLESGPQFRFVSMTRDITPMQGVTPYMRSGNYPVVILLLLVLLGCIWFRHRRSS
jgi:apolipoprotein N-acyltransferase